MGSHYPNKEKIKQMNSKSLMKNIKSKYILKQILGLLPKGKLLQIFKYNKEIRNKIGLNIIDYKEYMDLFSPIELEIIPLKNKLDKIINISKEEDELYYHLFFNHNKTEINRNNYDKNIKVKNIKIKIDYQVNSLNNLFEDCESIKLLYFKKFYMKNINDLIFMFIDC